MKRTWVTPWREIFHKVRYSEPRAVNVEIWGDRVRVFVEGPGGGPKKVLSLDTVSAGRLACALIVAAEEIEGRPARRSSSPHEGRFPETALHSEEHSARSKR